MFDERCKDDRFTRDSESFPSMKENRFLIKSRYLNRCKVLGDLEMLEGIFDSLEKTYKT